MRKCDGIGARSLRHGAHRLTTTHISRFVKLQSYRGSLDLFDFDGHVCTRQTTETRVLDKVTAGVGFGRKPRHQKRKAQSAKTIACSSGRQCVEFPGKWFGSKNEIILSPMDVLVPESVSEHELQG
jgi:hypothetical protein